MILTKMNFWSDFIFYKKGKLKNMCNIYIYICMYVRMYVYVCTYFSYTIIMVIII